MFVALNPPKSPSSRSQGPNDALWHPEAPNGRTCQLIEFNRNLLDTPGQLLKINHRHHHQPLLAWLSNANEFHGPQYLLCYLFHRATVTLL